MWPVPSSSHARKRPTTRAVLRARASISCVATGGRSTPPEEEEALLAGLRPGSDELSLPGLPPMPPVPPVPPMPPACWLSAYPVGLPSAGLPLLRRRGGESGSEEADFAVAQYSQMGLASASPRIFKRWFETHIGPFATHAARRTCFNGMWTSTRALLQSRERAFCERLRHETDVHASSEAVHYAERAARAIFGGHDPSATTFVAGEAIMATVSLNLKGVRPSVRIMLPDLAPAHEGVCGPAFRVWFAGSHGTRDLPSKTPWCPPLEAGVVLPLPTEVQALLAAESEGTRLHVVTAASHWEIPVRELPRVTHHQEVVRRGCCEVEVVCC